MASQRILVALLAVAVALSGCGTDDTVGGEQPDTASPTATASPEVSPSPADSPAASPEATPDLPGEPFDGPPLNGQPAELAVIGVATDDVLNVRAAPGTDAEIVATLAPLATGVPATGRAQLLPGSIWTEVESDGVTGWANSSFFAFLGATNDITARLLADLDERPSASTLAELAQDVAALVASSDPPSQIVISDGPSVGDLGEVTVDVIGLGDDSVRGLRLVVFATQEGGTFELRSVEATDLCGRGLSAGTDICL